MQIDIKYGNTIISTIEEKEALTLATKDTLLTENITVDVVDGGGIIPTDATAMASDVAAGKTFYNNVGRNTGNITKRYKSDITREGPELTVPEGYYKTSETIVLPSTTAVAGFEKSRVSNTEIDVIPKLIPTLTGVVGPNSYTGTTTIVPSDIVTENIVLTNNGLYTITNYATAQVDVPKFDGTTFEVVIDKIPSKELSKNIYVFSSALVDKYPSCSSKTYTGSTVTTDLVNYFPPLMSVSGTTSAINRGTYTCTFTLLEGFKFKDTNLSTRLVTWEII